MLKDLYTQRYQKDKVVPVYPVEFVVRAFLGTYPELQMPKKQYEGRRILDLGYGDGRNMPLLKNLGLKIYGVEISDEINSHNKERLKVLGIDADLRLGSNSNLPFEDSFFSYLLACHSCYYISPGETFTDNLNEISRVIEPSGYFIGSFPMSDTYILKDAKKLSDGHFEITNDPFGLRNGTVFRAFDSEGEVKSALSPYFGDIKIGFCQDMFWGIHQKVWIVVARRLDNKIFKERQ